MLFKNAESADLVYFVCCSVFYVMGVRVCVCGFVHMCVCVCA